MKADKLSYLITVSRAHLLPAQMLLATLRQKTDNKIYTVGNLDKKEASLMEALGAIYIDENDIDMSGRLPKVGWETKYRQFGWYKQMFIRLSIDRFIDTEQVVILDSEVFVFDNWDEKHFYSGGRPKMFYWTPQQRKPEWDYRMYRGAAYLLSFLPECKGIMEYANSTEYKRHISGVVLFSTANVARLWERLEQKTDLKKNLDDLFNKREDLAFSDHDIYGLAVEHGLFDKIVPTKPVNELLGWYEVHDDPKFEKFKKHAMWSMCQAYTSYNTAREYQDFMNKTAKKLGRKLPQPTYWNKADRPLIDIAYDAKPGIGYFKKYKKQLNHTFRSRFDTMYTALKLLAEHAESPVIVEVGTLRDSTKGGGHSTYKFGEFCARFNGRLHTVDILPEAIEFSQKATADFQPWISYHVEDSEKFLKNIPGKIDMLYLDGFDSTPGQELAASKKQLGEIKAALPHLSNHCVVLLDDADLPEGGKAKFSSEFLKKHGFDLEIDAYQQLYVRRGVRKGVVSQIGSKLKRAAWRAHPKRTGE